MNADSHPASDCPSAPTEGQLAIYGIDDPTWVAMILRRLKAGDSVRVDRVGDLLIGPTLDNGSRLDT